MKAKGLRIVANLILWIGVVACLLGAVLALLLSNGITFGIATDYVPTATDFIILGVALAVFIRTAIILHVIANVKEKRARIAACWAEAEAIDVLGEDIDELADEDALDVATATEELEADEEEILVEDEAAEEEAPVSKLQFVKDKIVEKTPLTAEQVDKAEKIGKIAVPVVGAVAVLAMTARLGSYRKQAKLRRLFYDWLG